MVSVDRLESQEYPTLNSHDIINFCDRKSRYKFEIRDLEFFFFVPTKFYFWKIRDFTRMKKNPHYGRTITFWPDLRYQVGEFWREESFGIGFKVWFLPHLEKIKKNCFWHEENFFQNLIFLLHIGITSSYHVEVVRDDSMDWDKRSKCFLSHNNS